MHTALCPRSKQWIVIKTNNRKGTVSLIIFIVQCMFLFNLHRSCIKKSQEKKHIPKFLFNAPALNLILYVKMCFTLDVYISVATDKI